MDTVNDKFDKLYNNIRVKPKKMMYINYNNI